MIKVLNNIKNKIINIFFEEVSETEHKEILNKDELNELRNKLGRLNITRLYGYDSLVSTLPKKEFRTGGYHKDVYLRKSISKRYKFY